MNSKKVLLFLIVFGLLATSCASFAEYSGLKLHGKLQIMLLMLSLIEIRYIRNLMGISILVVEQ